MRLLSRPARDPPPTRVAELLVLRRATLALLVLAALGALFSYRATRWDHAPDDALGATLAPVAAARPGGVLVTSLRADGAAARAGLLVGDRLDSVDGRPARSLADVERAMASGDRLSVRVHRGQRAVALSIAMRGKGRHVVEDIAGGGRYHHG
jgi:predicted metalloprotease with PDZ domain